MARWQYLIPVGAVLAVAPAVMCAATVPVRPGVCFEDVSALRGLGEYPMAEWIGGGAAASDFDGDGDIDLFVPTTHGSPNLLYRNRGDGVFDEVGALLGVASVDSARIGLWFDHNGDHRQDLLVLGDYADFGEDRADLAISLIKLYQQQADGTFEEVSGATALDDTWLRQESQPFGGACAGDINNDGYLDLCMSIWHGPSRVLVNEGGVRFRSVRVPEAGTKAGFFQPIMLDVNRDGFVDLYHAVDYGPNQLWVNNGDETFTERGAEAGIDHDDTDMGVTVGDYNNDGRMDLFISNIAHNALYKNIGSGREASFLELSGQRGVEDTRWGWGCSFFDADCDGWLDLAVTNGWDSVFWPADPSRFFRNTGIEGPGRFEDESAASGFNDELWGCTLLAADFDRDGDQDLLQTIHADVGMTSRLRLLDNRPAGGAHYGHWFAVRLSMDGPNHLGIGAVVRVRAGELAMSRLLTAGISFLGQEPAEAFFGLGAAEQADAVTVEWPGGGVTTFIDLPADQLVTLRPPGNPPVLSIQRNTVGGSLELSWDRGALQRHDQASGTWVDVPGAVSPWTVSLAGGAQPNDLFRLVYELED